MTGVIVSLPPLVEQPPGSNASNPAGLPGFTYTVAVLGIAQTWAALQTFPLGMISLHAADILDFASLLSSTLMTDQQITAAGPATVNTNAGIVRVNQTVGAPITLVMPLASAKTCAVLISDWKGDSGTNKITINLSGSDKFPGNLTSWAINADTASLMLRPIPGVGYAL